MTHIRPLNLDNSGELHAYYTCFHDAELAENADRPTWSEPDLIAVLTEPIGKEVVAFGAFEDDENERLVGAAFLSYPILDNTTMAWTGVFVAPEHAGRGIGSQLVSQVVERAAKDGRPVMLSEATYAFDRRDDHPYRRFAERHGFAVASTDIWRRLDLPVPDEQIQAWLDEAAPHHADYSIKTYSGDMPDDVLPSMCHAVNQLILDAPSGDIDFEAEQVTPEIWRQMEAVGAKRGLHRYDTVAVDVSGEVVAVTTLAVREDDPDKVMQWATVVVRAHRGHRLGLAVKATNLRAVQRDYPDRTSIYTCNAEDNGPMVDINDRIGLRPVELCVAFQRKLSG